MGLPHRWRLQEWAGRIEASAMAPVVIGGCGSSGTTLVRRILDRHPAIYCGPESTLFLSRITAPDELAVRFGFDPEEVSLWRKAAPSRTAFIERFQEACLARSGKRLWADKTPENLRRFPAIRRRFPQAKFIHVIRDGRDVACSLRQAPWMSLETMTGGADRASPQALEACIRYWAERVRFGRTLADDPQYCEVRYETLLSDPEATLKRVLGFLGVDWDPAMLKAPAGAQARDDGPLVSGSVGRWRRELSAADAKIVERQAGGLLRELGYAADDRWTRGLPDTPGPVSLAAADGRPLPWPRRVARAGKRLRREAVAVWFALRDRRFPRAGRWLGLAAAAYLVLPFDLIPDRIPVFGYADDAVALLLVALFVKRLAPRGLLHEQRHAAALYLSRRIWAISPREARA